jgi:hypothetical protein
MKYLALLTASLLVALSSVSAEAKHRWISSSFDPWQDDAAIWTEDDGDMAYDDEDDQGDSYRRSDRVNVVRRAEDDRLWWLEDNARNKLEQRKSKRSATLLKKSTPKPKVVASVAPKSAGKSAVKAAVKPKQQIASLQKPMSATRQRPIAIVEKTIGCTAGAAVVTAYGFAEVRPKTCTGKTYAYTAARAGKTYDIQLTAASGEIIDVKKR